MFQYFWIIFRKGDQSRQIKQHKPWLDRIAVGASRSRTARSRYGWSGAWEFYGLVRFDVSWCLNLAAFLPGWVGRLIRKFFWIGTVNARANELVPQNHWELTAMPKVMRRSWDDRNNERIKKGGIAVHCINACSLGDLFFPQCLMQKTPYHADTRMLVPQSSPAF